MSFYESYGETIGSIAVAKEVFERERNVARLPREVDLREGEDGSYVISKRKSRYHKDDSDTTLIVYTNDNCVHMNLRRVTLLGYGMMELYNQYIPDSSLIYENNQDLFLVYEPGKAIRTSHDNKHIDKVFKVDAGVTSNALVNVSLLPDGKVLGAKKIKRGPSTEADPKPLKEHLEKKHYTKMAKARLDNDLRVEYSRKWATFRGISLGLYHYCIELWSQKEYMHGRGPNSGLIRRLYVGRFLDSCHETRMNDLAVKILKDIPLSSLNGKIHDLCSSARGA